MAFAIGFGVLGAIGGFVLGFGLSAFDELILNKGNPQGPLLFLLTGPLGVFAGLLYGIYKGYTHRVEARTGSGSESDE